MMQYKKIFELKNKAKDTLDGKYGGVVLLQVLSVLITNGVQFLISNIATATVYTVYSRTGSESTATAVSLFFDLLLLAASALLYVLNAGITLYYLNMACKQPLSVTDLFYGFRTDSSKILVIACVTTLCTAICLYPSQYLLQPFLNTGETKWLFYALLALILGTCIYLPVNLGIRLSFYFMLDFPQNSAKETLTLCWRRMKGNRKRLFCMEASFLPLTLLCILSFGIGFLWLEPYKNMTRTYFFLDMMNPIGTNSQS